MTTPHEQMREALRQNVRAFRHKDTGEIAYAIEGFERKWEEVMIIPNLPNEVIDEALAAPEPAPMVRLTRYETALLEIKCADKDGEIDAEYFANELQDAIIAKNKGGV